MSMAVDRHDPILRIMVCSTAGFRRSLMDLPTSDIKDPNLMIPCNAQRIEHQPCSKGRFIRLVLFDDVAWDLRKFGSSLRSELCKNSDDLVVAKEMDLVLAKKKCFIKHFGNKTIIII